MTKYRFSLLFLLIFFLAPRVWSNPRYVLYGFASLRGDTSSAADPFRYPAGFGIGAEVFGLGAKGLVLSIDGTWNGLEPSDPASSFGSSWLLTAGLSVGWRFFIPMSQDSAIHITPKLGGGFYVRSLDYLGTVRRLGKPLIQTALEGGLLTENRLIMDVAFTVDILLDNTVVWLPGVRLRAGYVFGRGGS